MKDIRVYKEVEIKEIKREELNIGKFIGEEITVEHEERRGDYQEDISGYICDENGLQVNIDDKIFNIWQYYEYGTGKYYNFVRIK